MTENELSFEIIGSAIEVHRILGPGLLESGYEECLLAFLCVIFASLRLCVQLCFFPLGCFYPLEILLIKI
jgi:hypothetical protein